jgi:hypothetical protein
MLYEGFILIRWLRYLKLVFVPCGIVYCICNTNGCINFILPHCSAVYSRCYVLSGDTVLWDVYVLLLRKDIIDGFI